MSHLHHKIYRSINSIFATRVYIPALEDQKIVPMCTVDDTKNNGSVFCLDTANTVDFFGIVTS